MEKTTPEQEALDLKKTQEEIDLDLDFHMRSINDALWTKYESDFDSSATVGHVASNAVACYEKLKALGKI